MKTTTRGTKNKVLLYSAGNSIQYLVINCSVKENEEEYIYIYVCVYIYIYVCVYIYIYVYIYICVYIYISESLCCATKINTEL